DFVDFLRRGDDARIARINAVHVGVDLAEVGFHRGCEGDRGEVAAAATEGGDALIPGFALEAGDDADIAVVEVELELLRGRSAIFARVWTPSVTMPACAPVSEIAFLPSALMAIAVRAMVVCSPVA